MSLKHQLLFMTTILLSTPLFADCLDTETNRSPEFLSANRMECLKKARFLLNAPDVNAESFRALLTNPGSKKEGLTNGETVYCRYTYQSQNGSSAKFRCAKTNDKNQLYDSKGELVPEAQGLVAEGGEVYLTGANNEKLVQQTKSEKTKFRKAMIMKIRYKTGDKRNVENYTSSAASRVFWALGLPAHSNYMTEKIVCFGCGGNPFKDQKEALFENGQPVVTQFTDASIEVKFDAKRLYSPTQQPWTWSELNALYKQSTNEIRTEIEVLALASQFIGAIGKSDMQNAIVCTKFDKTNKDQCLEVMAMAHDLGAAFGSRVYRGFSGGEMPRGDLVAYDTTRVFYEGSCQFLYSDGGRELPLKVSAAGKAEFLKRAAVLTKENLKTIFAASHMGRLHNSKEKYISSQEDLWVRAVESRLQEVQQAPCN